MQFCLLVVSPVFVVYRYVFWPHFHLLLVQVADVSWNSSTHHVARSESQEEGCSIACVFSDHAATILLAFGSALKRECRWQDVCSCLDKESFLKNANCRSSAVLEPARAVFSTESEN